MLVGNVITKRDDHVDLVLCFAIDMHEAARYVGIA